ncbi:MAG: DMT family transporter [Bacteroidota bacterium]
MKIKNLLMLLLLASIWGPSFLLIKIAVAEIPPMLLAAMRIAIAAITLFMVLKFKKEKLSRNLRFWKHVAIAGLFAHAIPFTLFNWGELYIDSALASVLNGLTPLFTILIAHFTLKEERLTLAKTIGTVTGFLGLIVLLYPNMISTENGQLLGAFAIGLAALSYAVAIVYAKINLVNARPLQAPASQLIITAIYLLPVALLIDTPSTWTTISWPALTAVLILGVVGTGAAFVIYYRLLASAGASYLSLSVYVVPVYGIVLGKVFLNESLTIYGIIGTIIILAGLLLANSSLRWLQKPKVNHLQQPDTKMDICMESSTNCDATLQKI